MSWIQRSVPGMTEHQHATLVTTWCAYAKECNDVARKIGRRPRLLQMEDLEKNLVYEIFIAGQWTARKLADFLDKSGFFYTTQSRPSYTISFSGGNKLLPCDVEVEEETLSLPCEEGDMITERVKSEKAQHLLSPLLSATIQMAVHSYPRAVQIGQLERMMERLLGLSTGTFELGQHCELSSWTELFKSIQFRMFTFDDSTSVFSIGDLKKFNRRYPTYKLGGIDDFVRELERKIITEEESIGTGLLLEELSFPQYNVEDLVRRYEQFEISNGYIKLK